MQALFLLIMAIAFGVCAIATPPGDPASAFLGGMALIVAIAACFSLNLGDES